METSPEPIGAAAPDERAVLEQAARERLRVPALGLLATSALSFATLTIALVASAWLLVTPDGGAAREATGASSDVQVAARIAWNMLMQLASLFVFAGALEMRRLGRIGRSRTACIVACVPCLGPCFLLGIPFGALGLVALRNANVRRAFRSVPLDHRAPERAATRDSEGPRG